MKPGLPSKTVCRKIRGSAFKKGRKRAKASGRTFMYPKIALFGILRSLSLQHDFKMYKFRRSPSAAAHPAE